MAIIRRDSTHFRGLARFAYWPNAELLATPAASRSCGSTASRCGLRRIQSCDTRRSPARPVDFAHCRMPWGVRYALLVVIGHSRRLWVRFYPARICARSCSD